MATLIFDGDCAFCTRCAEWLEGRTSAEVVPWQFYDLDTVGLTEADTQARVYWVGEDGQPVGGGAAVAVALRSCGPGYRLLGALMALPGARFVTERVYRVVAANRYRLPGGTAACALPPPE